MPVTKTISIVGGACSGKSTLAAQTNAYLKQKGYNSIFIEEFVVNYIAENGPPQSMEHQLVVFNEQLRKETQFFGKKDFIICDSAAWASYIYGRKFFGNKLSSNEIATLNHLHRRVLESLNYWDHIFYVPVMEDYALDGVRFHNRDESTNIAKSIEGFLYIENKPFIDLTEIPLNERLDKVIETIVF